MIQSAKHNDNGDNRKHPGTYALFLEQSATIDGSYQHSHKQWRNLVDY